MDDSCGARWFGEFGELKNGSTYPGDLLRLFRATHTAWINRDLPDRSLTSVCMLHSRYCILAVHYHQTRNPGGEEAVIR